MCTVFSLCLLIVLCTMTFTRRHAILILGCLLPEKADENEPFSLTLARSVVSLVDRTLLLVDGCSSPDVQQKD